MYFKVSILIFLVADIYSANSHLNLYRNARIIGGKDAVSGQFPYVVSIQALPEPGSEYSHTHNCGGAILSEYWILTAAHCLHDDGDPLVVRAGKHDLTKNETDEQMAAVEKFFRHELYKSNVFSHDIGLMRLRTPLKLNERVAKIQLPEKDSEPSGQGTLAGWGYYTLEPGHPVASILQTVTFAIINRKTCEELIEGLNIIYSVPETNICTIGPPSGGVGGCGGDSGSPLVTTNDKGKAEVVGIYSWTYEPCGQKGGPNGYVRVSSFIDWIEDTVKIYKS